MTRAGNSARVDPPGHPDELESIGESIRSYRVAAGFTLEHVARGAGVSRSLVSQIERGVAMPSLLTLRGIARVFGITMADLFFRADATGKDCEIVRSGTGRTIMLPDTGVRYELLVPDLHRALEFVRASIPGGASVPGDDFSTHDGEESMHVLEGEIVLIFNGDEHVLRRGDTVTIKAEVPHRLENRTPGMVELLVAATPPSL